MTDEWGPWVDHDGKGFPPSLRRGQVIQAAFERMPGDVVIAEPAMCGPASYSWDWSYWGLPDPYEPRKLVARIIRYRVRKPRALIALREMVESLPERVDA